MPTPETLRDLLRRLIAHPPLAASTRTLLTSGSGELSAVIGADVFGVEVVIDSVPSSWGRTWGEPPRYTPRLATVTVSTPYGEYEPVAQFIDDRLYLPLPDYHAGVLVSVALGLTASVYAIVAVP